MHTKLDKPTKALTYEKIIIGIILITSLTIEEVILKDSFLSLLVNIFEIPHIHVAVFYTLFIIFIIYLIIFLRNILKKQEKSIKDMQHKTFTTVMINIFLIYFIYISMGGKVAQYTNITNISYYYQKDNERKHCTFDIKNRTFSGECEAEFTNKLAYIDRKDSSFDKSRFLKEVFKYNHKEQIKIWSEYTDYNVETGKRIYVLDKEIFNKLLINAI